MAVITTRALVTLSRTPGKWLSENTAHGHGTLACRCLAGGAIGFYFRFRQEGKQKVAPLGRYDDQGIKGLTLKEARDQAGQLAKIHAMGGTAIAEQVKVIHRAELLEAAPAAVPVPPAGEATPGTFGAVLDAYEEALRAAGKTSARQVASLFKRWIRDPFPHLLIRPAEQVGHDDIMTILRAAHATGVTRTVNKLRSYLLAAFNTVTAAHGDFTAPAHTSALAAVVVNPVARTVRKAGYDRALDRVLTAEELRDYLGAIKRAGTVMQSSALLLSLMLGGQRMEQLVRITPRDVDLSARTIRLNDPKGRRSAPRIHILPIPDAAVPVVQHLLAVNGRHAFLFSQHGDRHTTADRVGQVVRGISAGAYTMRDIRRTCETMLAALGVSKDIRAQVQSHGIHGVQARHYDKHDYMLEKASALALWNTRLAEIEAGA